MSPDFITPEQFDELCFKAHKFRDAGEITPQQCEDFKRVWKARVREPEEVNE